MTRFIDTLARRFISFHSAVVLSRTIARARAFDVATGRRDGNDSHGAEVTQTATSCEFEALACTPHDALRSPRKVAGFLFAPQ